MLLALQQQQQGDGGGCTRCSSGCDVASLGLLVLEGSCFLVNRVMLLQRLEDFYSVESTTAAGNVEYFGRAQTSTTECSNSGRCGVPRDRLEGQAVGLTAVGQSSEREGYPAPPAGNSSAAAQHQRQGLIRDFALMDVRKSLASPCDRSDFLVPKLHAALRSAFGGVAVAATAASSSVGRKQTSLFTDDLSPPPPGTSSNRQKESPTTAEATAKSNREDRSSGDISGEFCLAPAREEEGARWLRDWDMKEMSLDCESLKEILGDVGLPGLAGWLLEYPVIYCCPSLVGRTPNDDDRGEDVDDGALRAAAAAGTEAGHSMGNCLAVMPLAVFSLSFDIDKDAAGCCSPRGVALDRTPSSSVDTTSSHAFSFSVPETVRETAQADMGENEREKATGLHGLVHSFFARLESRIARHRRRSSSSSSSGDDCCCGKHQQLVHRLTVTKRTETLDRVAL